MREVCIVMKLSFICPSNNPQMFNDNVVKSLDIQKNRDFELILVDTQKEHYTSAAAALNAGAARASGEYLVFLHHDIVFESADFIDELLDMIGRCKFLIGGVAGTIMGDKPHSSKLLSNIDHGVENRRRAASKVFLDAPPFTHPMPLETVDECLFVIPAEVFKKRNFPEFIPTWHLYAVEYCLWAYEQDMENPVMLLPVSLWHLSAGNSLNRNYYKALRRLRKIYNKDMITSVGAWPGTPFAFEHKIFRHRLHQTRLKIRNLRRKWNI